MKTALLATSQTVRHHPTYSHTSQSPFELIEFLGQQYRQLIF
jgi:hypothetical protein